MMKAGCVRSRTDVGRSRIGRSQASLVLCRLVAGDEMEMVGTTILGLAVVDRAFKAQGDRPVGNDVVGGTSVAFGSCAANMSNRCGPSSTERTPFLGLGETFVASHYIWGFSCLSRFWFGGVATLLYSRRRGPRTADNVRLGTTNRSKYRKNCQIE
jgi:hypothetical protein